MKAETLKSAFQRYSAVILSGGSSGIGECFIKAIWNLNEEALFCNLSRTEPVINLPKVKLHHFSCDLSKPEALAPAFKNILQVVEREAGGGEILILNNSGFGSYGPFPKPSLDHQLKMVEVNIKACVHLAGFFLPLLKKQGGVIVNIASTAAFLPTPFLSTYGATKAFLLHWSLALNEDLRETGVRTLAICPGPTRTQFFKRAGFLNGQPTSSFLEQSVEDVVEASLVAVATGKTLFISGWKNRLMTFFSTKLPKTFAARVAANVLRKARLEKQTR